MTEPIAALYSTPGMAAIFEAEALVQGMLAFEAALARSEARAGVIPEEAATAIAAACRVERFDVAALSSEAGLAGTLAIPLVRALTERVEGEGKRWVHWGATSQDAIDTAIMLQIRQGLDLLTSQLLELCTACAALAERHRITPMAGRTLLQQALPISFGLKAARWLALAARQCEALSRLRSWALVVQFGGAAGTLAVLGDQGLRVSEFLAEELGLALPDLPWHAERDRIAAVASALGVTAGAMAKIASDVILLAQTEVGEVREADEPGKGGSSTLPQKRNPVDAVFVSAASRLAIGLVPVILSAMAQEQERGAGGWQAEWAAIPDLFRFTSGAIAHGMAAVAGLEVDGGRMRANLDLSGGLIMAEALTMALAPSLGRQAAQSIVAVACKTAVASEVDLRQVALADQRITAVLSSDAIDEALDPAAYLGSTNAFIDRALAHYQTLQGNAVRAP